MCAHRAAAVTCVIMTLWMRWQRLFSFFFLFFFYKIQQQQKKKSSTASVRIVVVVLLLLLQVAATVEVELQSCYNPLTTTPFPIIAVTMMKQLLQPSTSNYEVPSSFRSTFDYLFVLQALFLI